MEIARLRHTNRHCPAGTMPFFDSFGTSFQCVPIGRGFAGDETKKHILRLFPIVLGLGALITVAVIASR